MPDDRPRTSQLPSDRVEADLRARLARGDWGPGERLPSVGEFAAEYDVSRNTVLKVLRRIESDGLIQIVSNWGTFVAERE